MEKSTMKKLVSATDTLFNPAVPYNYVLVIEKIHPNSKKPVISVIPCVLDDQIFDGIRKFMTAEIDNPDAVRGVHYDIGIYRRDRPWERDLLQSMFPPKPKPDKLHSRGLYLMRRHRGWNYNIFKVDGKSLPQYYAGIIFDRNRRPYYQTHALLTTASTITLCRDIIDLLVKSQCVPDGMAFKIDEGKAIRDREDALRSNSTKKRRKGECNP